MPATPKTLFKGSLLLGSAPTRANVSNVAITTNLATITTSAAHGAAIGDLVTIQGAHASIDGTYVIFTVPSSTTFTFVSTTATLSSAAVSPVGVATFNANFAGQTVTNRVIQNFVTTITTGSAHGLAVNDTVAVTIGLASVDTLNAKVIAIPTSTTFCYVSTTQTLATASVTQGFFAKQTAYYTAPASTTTIVSNLVVTNESASSATFSLALNNNRIAESQTIAANSSAYFDMKQTLETTTTITGGASAPTVLLSASGVEVV